MILRNNAGILGYKHIITGGGGGEPTSDLQVKYTFDNDDLTDGSGNGRHGTAVGSVTYIDGKVNRAAQIAFSNNLDRITAPYVPSGNFTVCFWFMAGADNHDWLSG